jgi:hypothetical protein
MDFQAQTSLQPGVIPAPGFFRVSAQRKLRTVRTSTCVPYVSCA